MYNNSTARQRHWEAVQRVKLKLDEWGIDYNESYPEQGNVAIYVQHPVYGNVRCYVRLGHLSNDGHATFNIPGYMFENEWVAVLVDETGAVEFHRAYTNEQGDFIINYIGELP